MKRTLVKPRKTIQKSIPLDLKFWKDFSKNVWEKKAVVYPGIESPLQQIDESRIFRMLVQYADRCRKRKNPAGVKLYLEGVRQYEEDTLQFLPQKKDKSLLGYHDRMQAQFPDYCLVCDELLQVSLDSWGLLADFARQLYQHIGFPNRFSELGLYLGNYQKTPFGVHVDGCGVFSFPAVGTKKFRLWNPQYVKKNPDLVEAHEYDRFKKHSQVLVVNPGGMTYWPSKEWHIAESDGSFSATWSLGVWVDRSHKDVMKDALTALLQESLGLAAETKTVPFHQIHQSTGEMAALPELYQATANALQDLTSEGVQNFLLKTWMASTSKQGLKSLPVHSTSRKLKFSDRIQNRMPSPILWSVLQDSKTTALAFNGQVWTQKVSKEFKNLIRDLNQGHICQIDSYLKKADGLKELSVLQALLEAGAVVLEK